MEKMVREIAARLTPYLPDLPPVDRIGVYDPEVWEGVDGHVLGFARPHTNEWKIGVRSGLEREELEFVILHELLHLGAPELSESWVRALDGVLLHAVREGYPPRDLASLAYVSMEELLERVGPLPVEVDEAIREMYPDSRYLPLYLAMGVLPDANFADNPLYFFQQVAAGLPLTDSLLRRVWLEPPLTQRGARRKIRKLIAEISDEEFSRLREMLGDGATFDPALEAALQIPGWPFLPAGRASLAANLMDAVTGEGEVWEPPEIGDPYEVVAGWLATGRGVGGGA